MAKYLVVIERVAENFSAYCPDLPGCVATGASRDEVERNIREAIEMHVQGLMEDNLPLPSPETTADYVAIEE